MQIFWGLKSFPSCSIFVVFCLLQKYSKIYWDRF